MSALDSALDRGDARTAWRLARHLKREAITLDYALALLLLITDDADRYGRGAARWLERWARERPRTTSAELAHLAATLDGLPGLEGITSLASLCDVLGLSRAAATLVHLYPVEPGRRRGGVAALR